MPEKARRRKRLPPFNEVLTRRDLARAGVFGSRCERLALLCLTRMMPSMKAPRAAYCAALSGDARSGDLKAGATLGALYDLAGLRRGRFGGRCFNAVMPHMPASRTSDSAPAGVNCLRRNLITGRAIRAGDDHPAAQ